MGGFLQAQFDKFHGNIRLSNLNENRKLQEKRDLLFTELVAWLKDNDKPLCVKFDQGSYAMNTGIGPTNGRDYDIDTALEFLLDIKDYPDPTVVKGWVVEALSNHPNRTVICKTPCVRVQYHKDGEEDYHVDFAIYGKYYFLGIELGLKLAKGKLNSNTENKKWEEAEPKELKKLLQGRFENEYKRRQFKRVIRYFKRWKDYNFSADGNKAPTGIALTAMAYNLFEPQLRIDWNGKPQDIDDLQAMKQLVNKIVTNNYGLGVRLPVKPYNDLFEKMKQSESHIEDYKRRMDELQQALVDAADAEPDEHAGAEILQKVLGPDFPVPDKKDTAEKSSAPAIIPSTESA